MVGQGGGGGAGKNPFDAYRVAEARQAEPISSLYILGN